jgi:peptidyl-Lys metalloendopeptidase
VTRDGKPVQYEGPMIKRPLPSAADFTVLRPGETRRVVVDLSGAYDLSQTGDYTVTFASPLQHASLVHRRDAQAIQRHPDDREVRAAAPVGRRQRPVVLQARNAAEGQARFGRRHRRQRRQLRRLHHHADQRAGNAVVSARSYTENRKGTSTPARRAALHHVVRRLHEPRYSTVRQHFVDIDAAMDQNAARSRSTAAATRTTTPTCIRPAVRDLRLPVFWTAPLTGTDSKAGTLIHEMSHFNVVAGTDDHVYGQSGAKSLAISDPAAAIDNADSHEYFAENNPQQN